MVRGHKGSPDYSAPRSVIKPEQVLNSTCLRVRTVRGRNAVGAVRPNGAQEIMGLVGAERAWEKHPPTKTPINPKLSTISFAIYLVNKT